MDGLQGLAARLRAAGSVWAEEEAGLLVEAADGDPDALERLVARRIAGEPLEPLVGRVDFGGLRLSVGPGVFVPRQRTLLLARAALHAARRIEGRVPVVVEAYCGVAPVAAQLAARLPAVELHVTDLDPAALAHAARNVPGAGIHRGAALAGLPPELAGRVDLIAAVPPYVPDGEVGLLPREARDHEPLGALAGGADGLDEARVLLEAAVDVLAPGGRVLIELNRRQYRAAAAHARGLGCRTVPHRGGDGQTVLLDARR